MQVHSLRAGVATVDITPPMGVEMCGYGPYEKRVCTEVLDPLFAKALMLESGSEKIVIISLDLCMVSSETRDQAALRIHDELGIPDTNVMVVATHTHSGPATLRTVAWGEPDPAYMERLPGLIVRAAVEANADLQPARLGSARARIEGVGINREQTLVGPIDTAAQLMRVDREDGGPLAILFNFGAHAVVRYPFTSRISADWPGMVAAALELQFPGSTALFIQGPCGNVNGNRMNFARDHPVRDQRVCDMWVGETAARLTNQIVPALHGIMTSSSAGLKASLERIELPTVRSGRSEIEQKIAANRDLANSRTLEDLAPLCQRLTRETAEDQAWRMARYEVDACQQRIELLDEADPVGVRAGQRDDGQRAGPGLAERGEPLAHVAFRADQ